MVRFTYTALSPLCPDVELHSEIEACQFDPDKNRNWYDYDEIMEVAVNDTAGCYVPDCSEESFAWDWDMQWMKGRAWTKIYVALAFMGAGLCFLICCLMLEKACDN